MTVNPLNDWKSKFKDMPKSNSAAWGKNLADLYSELIQNIETDPTALQSVLTFTFQKPIFASLMMSMPPVTSSQAGALGVATAWETAILASTVAVANGAIIPPPSPATTFSVVASSVIDPQSIIGAKKKILELASAKPTSKSEDAKMPVILREATLLLTITVTGTDSTPPPSGPLPLTAPNIPLV